jgi:phosphoribosyl-AMP cyclohydrolase
MISLNFSKGENGLLPAIAQDYQSGEVLMLAYINEQAFEETMRTGIAHYWSRSRGKIWQKGESSGHIQKIHSVLVDCDEDTVVYQVEQIGGAACHQGYRTCFYRKVEEGKLKIFKDLIFNPKEVYKNT